MKKLLMVAAGVSALGAAGCDVNVSSNDARTQNVLNQAQDTLGDLGNEAGNMAADTGNALSNAAQSAGNGIQDLGNRADNVSIDINTNTAGNRQ
jgi:hypothetical protein